MTLTDDVLKELRESLVGAKRNGAVVIPLEPAGIDLVTLVDELIELRSRPTNGGWIEIPDGITDLGDCFVGRWYPGKKFCAFQRNSPCPAFVELSNHFTHYRPISPPLIEHPKGESR